MKKLIKSSTSKYSKYIDIDNIPEEFKSQRYLSTGYGHPLANLVLFRVWGPGTYYFECEVVPDDSKDDEYKLKTYKVDIDSKQDMIDCSYFNYGWNLVGIGMK